MAEEGSVYELEGLEKQLESLLSRYSSDGLRADSKPFCSDFCKLVEEYASRWQVPLPQLRILEAALRHFARASTSFGSNCDHVLHTLSSLALSVFELLLFFDQRDFHQEPLKHFTVTFQECHLALARHQNVHLLQVERLVQGGGPWAGPTLQSILSESSLPQSEVDGCISSELPVFFELRVRYLLSCERVSEAMALAKCCAAHPTAGQHLFFLQVYLTWLFKTAQHDRLQKEVAGFNGEDAVHFICSLECEEKDEVLLALSRAFLSQQLRRGDMYYLCDLVFIWSKLHSRLNTSKQALLEESHQLMLSATNINSIFPFIRAILQGLGEDGIQFCVELCANALRCCRPCDVITKSLIYKTIAGLLPDDLEVSRACALLVFFLERTVETYKMVYLLYMHPDQEYHVECSPIRNHVRFETLQVLKKDLYFDPEFWNLIALRTNCLKLMSEKVVSGALEEIMEDSWILSYCTKEPAFRSSASVCQKGSKGTGAKKRHHKEDRRHKEDTDTTSKRLKVGPGKTRLNDHTVKKKGYQGSASSEPLRRSFWQLDRLQDNAAPGYGELRRTTRLSEKNPPKRRIRTPKWLLEDSGTLGENSALSKIKKHGLKHQKHHGSSVVKRLETGELKNNAKHKPSVNSHFMARENNSKPQKGVSLDCLKPSPPPQVILELSLPDNELMGTFSEDTCNRQRGFPQVLLYRPTVKVPVTSQAVKTVHRKEVILRARDAAMFTQQLHCYARRQKGKGNRQNIQGSVSTITRSSVQGSPPKDSQREFSEKPATETKSGTSLTPAEVAKSHVFKKASQAQSTKAVSRKTLSGLSEKSAAEMKVTNASQTSAGTKVTEAPMLDKVLQAQTSERELCEESAVEMKVTIASTAAKVTQSPGSDKVAKAVKDTSKTTSAEVSPTPTLDNNQMVATDKILAVSNMANISNTGAADPTPSQSQDDLRDAKQELKVETGKNATAQAKADTPEVLTAVSNSFSEEDVTGVSSNHSKGHVPCENDTSGETIVTAYTPTDPDSANDISALTLVTEVVTELAPETLARDLENRKQPTSEDGSSKASTAGSKSKVPHKSRTTSTCSVLANVQGKEEGAQDVGSETQDGSDIPESEESRLEYCCTFCNKVFKGTRVVAHAMFHYRKDECMFCGTLFKDDLLAMMHLSDHIEKLKRSKESLGNNDQENGVSETKDTPKASAKAKTTTSGHRSSGRPRKSTDCLKSMSLPDSTPSGSRELRSNNKPADGPSLHEKKQNVSKYLYSKTLVHKVNGHIGKTKQLDGRKRDNLNSGAKQQLTQQISQERTKDGTENSRLQDTDMDSSATSTQADTKVNPSSDDKVETQVLKTATKQSGKFIEEKNVEQQEKVHCPVKSCGWFTDLSKNRVALLYHALEDHYGEVKPLELAFRVGNGKCSSCMRVMWSFEHFKHHIERHRLTPRHPCLHLGCSARFKTGMEMRRHARRHSPLQAVCCLPGCSQLFICLWALNLHEREHYASKPDKKTNEQTRDKHDNELDGKKQPDHKPKDAATSVKTAARKLRGETMHNSSKAPSPTTVSASLLKEELKKRNETKDSHVLKNLSNKDTLTQPTGPNLRLRQTLRKVQVATKSHKVISSLFKQNIKVRHKFKRKQVKVNTKGPKRRGRPPKSKTAVHDENTTAGQNNQTVVDKSAQLVSPPKAAETSNISNEPKEEKSQQVQDVAKTKSNKRNASTAVVEAKSLNQPLGTTSADRTQKLSAHKRKKLHKVKKLSDPKENARAQTTSSDSSKSKKHRVTNGKTNAIKTKCPLKEVEGKEKTEDSTQSSSSNSALAAPANSLNVITALPTSSGEKTQKITPEGKSKKPHIKTEGGKEKGARTVSLDKTNKKHKNIDKTEDTKTPKGASKTAALKKKSKPVDQQVGAKAAAAAALEVENSPDVGQKAEVGTHDGSSSSVPATTASGLNPPAAIEENKQNVTKKRKKSPDMKKSDPSKANKKRKNVHKEGDTKIVKKKRKDQGVRPAPEKPVKTVQPVAEVTAEVAGSSAGGEGKRPQSIAADSPGYSVIMNGQAAKEDTKTTALKDALAGYSNRPYVRPPPTAYLDEKYITMPKRRKELSFSQSSHKSPPPQQTCATTALQRQRCANCFATFNSAEDLQSHLRQQTCSNLFGFDSDDEGNSLTWLIK